MRAPGRHSTHSSCWWLFGNCEVLGLPMGPGGNPRRSGASGGVSLSVKLTPKHT